MEKTPVQKAIDWISTKAIREDLSLEAAARLFKNQFPDTALRVLETIGSWPSSYPELAALNRVWP